jgi:threonine dehydrogenase-like Zn-dependent dehydrogenase
MGHEVLARVLTVGEGVTEFVKGDRVVPDGLTWCGECEACRRGTPSRCARLGSIGLTIDGGLADLLLVPAAMCVWVPPSVPDRLAVLTEPLAVSVRAVRRAMLRPTDRVLIIGAGAIGQCVAQLAVREAMSVSVVGHDARRVEAMKAALPTVVDAADLETAECVFDCAGTVESFAESIRRAAPGGRVMLVGVVESVPNFSPLDLALKELTLDTSLSHDLDLDTRAAMRLLEAGKLTLDHVVTQVVPLAQAAARVFAAPPPDGPMRIKTVVQAGTE